ncbi:MAG: N-acetyltransferase [Desulfovibrionales bacterium]|nr:N-acetyltransferase [Desulfovibrionales bacterium]
MLIRKETSNDIETITHIEYAAFKNHPMHAPGSEPTEHRIVEELRNAGALSLSLVAEQHGEIVGHIALSPTSIGATSEGWFLLGPIGILPALQKKGIGSALMQCAIACMKKQGAQGIVLIGDPAFYTRFGFTAVAGITYEGVPDQFVLTLAFTKTLPKGNIVAHPAFSITE